jgi:hypothetical protein
MAVEIQEKFSHQTAAPVSESVQEQSAVSFSDAL